MAYKQISANQKKIIWAIWRKEIKGDDETLYTLLLERFDAERMSALSCKQADDLIRDLRRHQLNLGPDRLSPDQYRAIFGYAKYLGWTPQHLRNYMRQHAGVDDARWLTGAQARAILTGMEKIKQHEAKKEQPNGVQCQNAT